MANRVPILGTLLSGATEEGDVVGSDSLRFTTTAGFAAAVTAIVGAALPILDKINALDVSENIKIAAIGLVGAGILGWAISSAGDVLARAYATAHVHPASSNDETPTPALEAIVDKVIAELKAASPAARSQVHAAARAADAKTAALNSAIQAVPERTIIPLGDAIPGKHLQNHDCKIYALRQDAGDRTKLEYLLARQGEKPQWAPEHDVEVA